MPFNSFYYLRIVLLFSFVHLTLSAFPQLKTQNSGPDDLDSLTNFMLNQIDTSIDTNFLYSYEKTKYVPPAGKSLLIMGQTVERIKEYLENFPAKPIPGGWSAYWGIPSSGGISKPLSNETGSTQHHQMLVKTFPNTAIQSALWMTGKWEIAQKASLGFYDKNIIKYCQWAKKANRPIYLRIGYEFDGPHNAIEPKEFIQAYKYIVDLIRNEGVENIAFVWHSYAAPPFKDYPISAWYPGDDYVDWVAISVFGQAYGDTDFGSDCNDVLTFAKQQKKPVMIAESSPIYGIEQASTEVWSNWFVNLFSFAYEKNIKAISFINEDWTSFNLEGLKTWKDARIYTNQQISKAWFAETAKDRYLKQSENLFQELGYARDQSKKEKK